MELTTFNQFLAAAVKNGASDVHFKVGSSPALRINGQLLPVKVPALAAEDTARIAAHVLKASRWRGDLEQLQEHDTSYALEGVGRFRVSVFRNKGHLAAIMRSIPMTVPDFQKLGLPQVLEKMSQEDRGLILVTGVTGSGKSSTLAAIVNYINQHYRKHILTIEDPIEFLHEDKFSRITQREIGPDTPSFSSALRAALRQDPDVILVGEMRDTETIEIALKAAETGHLVLSTVHTTDCVRTIGRVVGVFPPEAQHGVRNRLADNLKGTISQRLLPHASGKGRVVAAEVMVSTLSVVEYIKDEARTPEIKDYLEKSSGLLGTQSFDQHLAKLIGEGKITLEVAKEAATNPADLERAISFE
ncbi:MAG TPA: PilT/PilU family type 4a pilus ATPase [Myxococcaceae bacterium]|nr:PilT/PilU family type 4a pilus ATPase [Myxococcaceae bacterium]